MRLNPSMAEALPREERAPLIELINTYNEHESKNRLKRRYYEGHVTVGEVNLGLALPQDIQRLEIGCAWGEKTVDVPAARSRFDGFVGKDGNDAAPIMVIVEDNNLTGEYPKACRDELKYGCTFATLSADKRIGCRIRWHSPETAAARWNGEKGRVDCGLAVVDMTQDAISKSWTPSVVNYYTDSAVWVLRLDNNRWSAEPHPNAMGRPLIEPMVWNATSAKPFGRSRLKEPIRHLIQGYVRTVANATIGLEFATSPQKYLLGVTDKQYEALVNQKFKTYVGSILTSTTNPETGEKPTFGQLSQGSIEPHVSMLRTLATQFSAATGLTVTDVGVINDANPSSADAILAQSNTLIGMVEELNAGNAGALYNIALMAQAIKRNVTLDELTDEERGIIARFKNPARPSVAQTADAAQKIASVRQSFAQTDVFLEMLGFSLAEIRRIKAQEQRARGLALFEELEA